MSENCAASEHAEHAARAIEVIKRIAAGEDLTALLMYSEGGRLTTITLNMSEQQFIAEVSTILFDMQLQRSGRKP